MFRRNFSFRVLAVFVSLLASPSLLAQAARVKIVSPGSACNTQDITTIASDHGEMLKAAPGYGGSSATATVLDGRSLIESYYHPEKNFAARAVLDNNFHDVVILPETGFLGDVPEATFDGVLRMSRRAFDAGSTPLLLMPRGGTMSIPKNDVGIDLDVANLAGIATSAVTSHCSTSRHLSGVVSYRTITPPNTRVHYAFCGTSTGGTAPPTFFRVSVSFGAPIPVSSTYTMKK